MVVVGITVVDLPADLSCGTAFPNLFPVQAANMTTRNAAPVSTKLIARGDLIIVQNALRVVQNTIGLSAASQLRTLQTLLQVRNYETWIALVSLYNQTPVLKPV